MPKFKDAHTLTVSHEGFYSNDHDDKGGETLWGWARNYHKRSAVWTMVDKAKALRPDLPADDALALYGEQAWLTEVEKEYKTEFWDKLMGDYLPNQYLANALYDVAVNGGQGRAVKFLQRSLNAHNRGEQDYGDLKVDGAMGNKSLLALTAYLRKRPLGKFIVTFDIYSQMNAHYLSSKQEKYTNGWSKRIITNLYHAAKAVFKERGLL